MAVSPGDIAVELGRPTPEPTSTQHAQWESWIARAMRAITHRATRLGVDPTSLDEHDVDDVVTYAVVRRITRPVDGAESTTDQIGVDDGTWNQTRRYPVGAGDIYFLPQWWEQLGLVEPVTDEWSGSISYSR